MSCSCFCCQGRSCIRSFAGSFSSSESQCKSTTCTSYYPTLCARNSTIRGSIRAEWTNRRHGNDGGEFLGVIIGFIVLGLIVYGIYKICCCRIRRVHYEPIHDEPVNPPPYHPFPPPHPPFPPQNPPYPGNPVYQQPIYQQPIYQQPVYQQPGVGYGGVAAGVGAGVLAGIALDQALNHHHDHNAVHTQSVTVDHGYYGDQVHTTTYDDDGYGNITTVDQDDF
ncbi:hypothetical protein HDV06_001350 [Boothiomyces sp. JEL0866]|nr:hypothetical protein HDV06_001350 [Boothiomyces sp. JEL0866]